MKCSLFNTSLFKLRNHVTIIKKYRAWLLAGVCLLSFATTARAQEETEEPPLTTAKPVPIAVAMVSGIDRGFAELDYVFEAIDHPELSDLFTASLANVRDLKGIDRKRPFGVMIFLKPGLFPQPAFAGFIPCEDFAECFSYYIRHKGRLPQRLANKPDIIRKWGFVASAAQ